MSTRRALLVTWLALLPLAAAAQSQTIWRCGTDGRSYSNVPCSEGRVLDAVATPAAADVQAAQAVARRERRLADTLREDRLRQEALAQRSGPAGIHAAAPVEKTEAPVATPLKTKKAKPVEKKPTDKKPTDKSKASKRRPAPAEKPKKV